MKDNKIGFFGIFIILFSLVAAWHWFKISGLIIGLGLVGFALWNKFKNGNEKILFWWLPLIAGSIAVIASIGFVIKDGGFHNVQDSQDAIQEKKLAIENKKTISEYNSEIEKQLEMDKGWALGQLDGNGNALPDGQAREKDSRYTWALAVGKIEEDGNGGINIYLTQEAMDNLTKADGYTVATEAQMQARGVAYQENRFMKLFNLAEDSSKGKTTIYANLLDNNGNEIAHTSAVSLEFNPKDFQ